MASAQAAQSGSSSQLKSSVQQSAFGQVIERIEIQGLHRIEKEAVLGKLQAKAGSRLTQSGLRQDIEDLYRLGYFDDIAVWGEIREGRLHLIYELKERPVIAKISFEGKEQLTAADFKDVVKLKDWSILDINQVNEDVAAIQKHYEEKGFFLAKVTYELRPTEKPDQLELVFKIQDFDKVQIKRITFLNNRKFSDDQLKAVFAETKEGGPFSFLGSSGNFKESAFKVDLQRLTYWYLEHGYVKFKSEPPVITVSDDQKWLFISIYVDEGEQYQIGSVEFGGDLLFQKSELLEPLVMGSGQIFSLSKRNQDIQSLTEKYQDLGYAFVNVVPQMVFHDDLLTIDLQYDFEKGDLVHFGQINIVGNAKTYDPVIRRELKIHEGELYNGSKLRLSKEAVERLGYFSPGEVTFNTLSVPGRSNVVNVEISVKERSTGTINVGLSYGPTSGLGFQAQVSDINFLGRGQTLSLAANLSVNQASAQRAQSFNLGFSDPYAFDTLWSAGFDVYRVMFPIPNKYISKRQGFDVRLGHPVWNYSYAYLTYKLEGMEPLDALSNVPNLALDAGLISSLTLSVIRDQRNNRFETTAGNYQSVSVEFAGLGGDKEFLKFMVNNRFYHRLIGDLVFRNSTEYGEISGRVVPPAQKFYLGGPNNLKGFRIFSLGPQVRLLDQGGNPFDSPLGGDVQLYSLFELEYPIVKEAGLKFVLFFDIGNTVEYGRALFPLRSDAGFGIRYFSPMGPLRFEWGYPLDRRPNEDVFQFQFFIGPPF
ncbi:MAG: outer membrane protein assembly factor BamA [Bdellovibrionia bacterium]